MKNKLFQFLRFLIGPALFVGGAAVVKLLLPTWIALILAGIAGVLVQLNNKRLADIAAKKLKINEG